MRYNGVPFERVTVQVTTFVPFSESDTKHLTTCIFHAFMALRTTIVKSTTMIKLIKHFVCFFFKWYINHPKIKDLMLIKLSPNVT